MNLVDLPIKKPVATLMLLLSLMVLGFVAMFRLPLDFMPTVEIPQVYVNVPFPGCHPLEALREVVKPIEEEVATIPEVKAIYGWANSGEAGLEVQFDWSAEVELKKMEVREAVERARGQLPEGIGYIRVSGEFGGPAGGAIIQGRISAERDLSESWSLLDRRIKQPLERIKGVARVDLYGVAPQEVRIDLDLDALRSHGVQPYTVLNLINAANRDLDAGAIHGDVLRYEVRTLTRFKSVEEIANLRLGMGDLRVRDVAKVEMREPRFEHGRHLDR
jgi:HAE1 family hydrophobic/amphiphilic exporter-1